MLLNARLVFCLVAIFAVSAHAETVKVKPQPVLDSKRESVNMTNEQAWKIYAKYLQGWTDISDEQRAKIAADLIADDVQYVTPRHNWSGRATIIEDMATFKKRFPNGHLEIGDVSANHDVALVTWVLKQDGKVLARGHDQFRVSPEGKIIGLVTFAPSVERP